MESATSLLSQGAQQNSQEQTQNPQVSPPQPNNREGTATQSRYSIYSGLSYGAEAIRSLASTSYRYAIGASQSQQDAEVKLAAALAQARQEDLSDLQQLGFLQLGPKDSKGRPVLVVYGKWLSPKFVDSNRLYLYFLGVLQQHGLLEAPYTLLYVHSEASCWQNSPGGYFLSQKYEGLPSRCQQQIQQVVILHSDLTLWLSLCTVCPLLSQGLWSKMEFVSRAEFLTDCIRLGKYKLPQYVLDHDSELEDQPLMDYGIMALRENMSLDHGPM